MEEKDLEKNGMNISRTIGVLLGLAVIALGAYVLLPVFGFDTGRTEIISSEGASSAPAAVPAKEKGFGRVAGQMETAPESTAELPPKKILSNGGYHVFQSFNNCAPAGLSIALSYYGISKSQEELAAELRPYNNPQGVNDDKSTVPQELADKAREFGLLPYYRVNGDIDILKQFIALDMPVLMRTLLQADEDFAHYRVVKGYDETTREIIQDDSYQGKNLRYSYSDFLDLWQEFNYEYLVLVPSDKTGVVEKVLGEEVDPAVAFRNAARRAEDELAANPNDVRARFNLSTSLYGAGDYERSVAEFEKIESRLPYLKMWYQMQPIQAYFELGNYGRVLALTESILARNISYSELYILRGQVYLEQDRPDLARAEFEKAVFYNKNSEAAREALAGVS